VVRPRAGVRRASLLATPRPFEEFPRSQPCCVTTACSLLAVSAPSGGRAPRSPLPVGGSGAVRQSPSTSRSCSANGSVASDTLSDADRSFLPWACVPFVVRLPPQPPGLPRATPKTRRSPRRPALSTVAKHRGGAEDIPPKRSAEAAAGVCPEGSFAASEDATDHHGVLDVERALRGAFPRSASGRLNCLIRDPANFNP
jgi:hypothetical protein